MLERRPDISSRSAFAFLFAHAVELVESFGEAARHDRFEARDLLVERGAPGGPITPGRRRIDARSGSA